MTDAEKRSADRMQEGLWNKVRHASEVHRQVRRYAQSFIKPGLSLTEMCEKIEQKNRDLVEGVGPAGGHRVPDGLLYQPHRGALHSPNTGDTTIIQQGDVMSVDFGTQIEGRIIDCAWTVRLIPSMTNCWRP